MLAMLIWFACFLNQTQSPRYSYRLAGDETACTRYRLQTFYLISVLISHVTPAEIRRDIDFIASHSNAETSDLDKASSDLDKIYRDHLSARRLSISKSYRLEVAIRLSS